MILPSFSFLSPFCFCIHIENNFVSMHYIHNNVVDMCMQDLYIPDQREMKQAKKLHVMQHALCNAETERNDFLTCAKILILSLHALPVSNKG